MGTIIERQGLNPPRQTQDELPCGCRHHFAVCKSVGKGGQGQVHSVILRRGEWEGMRFAHKSFFAKNQSTQEAEILRWLTTEFDRTNREGAQAPFTRLLRSGSGCLVMALYPQDLATAMERNQDLLAEDEDALRALFHSVFQSIAYLNAMGVFHRDLKPANLLLDRHFDWADESPIVVAVADFGFATRNKLNFTYQGTLEWVSPEVIQLGENVGLCGVEAAKGDAWAAGVMLATACDYGKQPFLHANHAQTICNIKNVKSSLENNYPSTPALDVFPWRHRSKELFNLVSQLLEVDPKRITVAQALKHPWFAKK